MLDVLTLQLPLWSDDPSESWAVRESRRARRLAVRVFQTGRVEIVVPPRTSRNAVERFVARHRLWIERKRDEARRNTSVAEPFPPRSIELTACAESWRVHLAGGAGRPQLAHSTGVLDSVRFPGAAGMPTSASVPSFAGVLSLSGDCRNARAVRQLLRRWLIGRARLLLGAQLDQCARELGFEYERAIVRRQRTRWGSCSVRGTISLNCCLLFQRREVLRYLMIHELAHTRHMNHSLRFWRCVGEHCPDHRALDRELLDGWRRVPAWVFGDA